MDPVMARAREWIFNVFNEWHERSTAMGKPVDRDIDPLIDRLAADRADLQARLAAAQQEIEIADREEAELLEHFKRAQARAERLATALNILLRACKAGAYVGSRSDAVTQADAALSPEAPRDRPRDRAAGVEPREAKS